MLEACPASWRRARRGSPARGRIEAANGVKRLECVRFIGAFIFREAPGGGKAALKRTQSKRFAASLAALAAAHSRKGWDNPLAVPR